MEHRPEGRSTAQRLCLLGASLALGSLGWILMGESESLTAAESPEAAKIMARVDGVAITEAEVQRTAAQALHRLEVQRKEILADALRQEVESQLLEAEATRRGITLEALLEAEVESRLATITEQDVLDFAAQQGAAQQAPGDQPTEEIRALLKEERRQAAYHRLVARLMEQSNVVVERTPSLPPELLIAGTMELARLAG